MTLRQWMERTKTTQQQLSEATGIQQPLISRYLLGKTEPKIHNALAIEKATKGEVPVSSWIKRSAA